MNTSVLMRGAKRNFKYYLHKFQVSKCQDQLLIDVTSSVGRGEVIIILNYENEYQQEITKY